MIKIAFSLLFHACHMLSVTIYIYVHIWAHFYSPDNRSSMLCLEEPANKFACWADSLVKVNRKSKILWTIYRWTYVRCLRFFSFFFHLILREVRQEIFLDTCCSTWDVCVGRRKHLGMNLQMFANAKRKCYSIRHWNVNLLQWMIAKKKFYF